MIHNKLIKKATVLRFLSIFVSLIFISPLLLGKQDNDSTFVNDVNQTKPIFEDNLDSMLNLWYVQNSAITEDLVNDSILNDSIISNIPDSVYAYRLSRIPSVFKLTYNPIVRKYIEMYTQQKRDRVRVMIGMTDYYFPIFDDIFDYYDVPNEMKYMSIIESALNPRARSRTRAIGVWQFMYGTGKRYGLTINSLVDERRDPVRETHAAAQFCKDLYDIFGDWQLVLAAYNCGPGNVNKAIRRAGGRKDFWDIYRYLPRETRGHVPAFIAAVYTINYAKEHNITPIPTFMPTRTDTVMVNRDLHLLQVAQILKLPIEQLRDLNPQYIHDIIPAKGTQYPLMLPVEYTGKFIDFQDSIYAYKDSIFFNYKELNKSPNYNAYSKKGGIRPTGNFTSVYYTVKMGDNLGVISEWFDCRINDLMDWNDLYSSRIRSGQRLVVYVPKKSSYYYQQINAMTFDQKRQLKNGGAVKRTAVSIQTTVNENQSTKFVYYTVKEGDTLWDIAKKYPGISDADIRKWNNLSESSNIIPGQQIKIKVM